MNSSTTSSWIKSTTYVIASIVVLSITYKLYSKRHNTNSKSKPKTKTVILQDQEEEEAVELLQPYLEQASQLAKALSATSISQNDRLMLYGLYKQATIGNCDLVRPVSTN